jgi:DNA-binding transcriptional LysR family regulator
MSLNALEAFVEVVDAQSFSKAAKRLSMPVSTVSAKIARLEDRLGVSLFVRTTRHVSVTDAGRLYYDHCTRALAELNAAEQKLAQDQPDLTGVLRLTAPPDIAQSVLTPILRGFVAEHPGIRVEMTVTNARMDLVADNIDLAVRIGKMKDSSLISRKFLESRMELWAAPSYLERVGVPSGTEDLAGLDFITLSIAEPTLTLRDTSGVTHHVRNSGRIGSDDMLSNRALIEAGAGIGILPSFLGEDSARARRLVRVLPHLSGATTTAYFVFPSQRFVPPGVRALIDWALSQSAHHRSG